MDVIHQPIWTLAPEGVYDYLKSTPQGLTGAEANERLARFGSNELPVHAQRPLWQRFADQLTHFMALLLWVAGGLAFVAGTPVLGWAIWAVIWINGVFSFWQEYQAERALAALKQVLPLKVKVLRESNLIEVPAAAVVRGDVIQIEEGDRIPADARLVAAEGLYLDVAVLTGESLPVARNAYPVRAREAIPVRAGKPLERAGEQPLEERVNPAEMTNLVLAGGTVAAGRGRAVVYATGAQTEFGQVARLTTHIKRDPSTLEIQVTQIVRLVTLLAATVGLTVFLLSFGLMGVSLTDSFVIAIGIIVAFVPEGLLPTITLALALGVQRMAKRNALVRRLSAIENLSATSVICTDKTGTLTRNEMSVRHLWIPWERVNAPGDTPSYAADSPLDLTHTQTFTFTGVGYDPTLGSLEMPEDSPARDQVQLLLLGSALCSNARLLQPTAGRWQEIGDPTEAALLVAATKAGFDLSSLTQQYPRRREVPFDSRRRMMTVVLDWPTGNLGSLQASELAVTKGAPLEVLRHCQSLLQAESCVALTPAWADGVIAANDNLARQGFRVLGLAVRPGDGTLATLSSQELEQHLIFVGLVALFDPPRPEVPEAIAQCHQAGIKVTMVTGDYGLTAAAIARQIGLVDAQSRVRLITGDSLGHLSDAQLRQIVKYRHNVVFARMAPEHKLRLVQAYKDTGDVVAVTGDGVNDAPALRAAHIGIAMGLNGTDVAREAADIVLTDDNFATIVLAIEEGRGIYENIRKFLTYILASNFSELIPFLAMVALKIPPALTVLQILAVDLGTNMVPALALGAEPAESGLMGRPPRRPSTAILNRSLMLRAYGFLGLIIASLSMLGFFLVWWSYGYDLPELQAITPTIMSHAAPPQLAAIYTQATTLAWAVIVSCQMSNLFACRSERVSVCRINGFNNPLLWVGLGVEGMTLVALIEMPWFRAAFNTGPLTAWQWLWLLVCPCVLLGAEELRKAATGAHLRRLSSP